VLAWTPLELVDRSYNLYSPSVTYPWVDTTELSSTETEAICGDWKFTLQMSPSLSSLDVRAFASNLPATFDLTIYSTDTDMIGSHDILVTAWMGIYSAWATTKTITVTIVDACLTTPITVPTTFGPDQYYWYTRAQITRPVDDFVPDLPYCVMSYSLANQDGSAYDGTLISEDLSSLVMQLSWETSDKAKVGDYPLRVTGGY